VFDDIWTISNKEDFTYELSKFIGHKRHARKLPLSRIEHAFALLSDMQSWIEMEGFHDLFYQQYTLSDCVLVEGTMREIGADRLADLFEEAKQIYMRRKTNLTEEEFRELAPFDIPEPDGSRFDEIADQFYGSDSQLFELGERLADFARKHRQEFSG
jgi:uncharacterized protein DUF4375